MSIRSTQLQQPGQGGAVAAAPFIEQIVGPEKGRIVELQGSKLSIGRSDDNDIVVQSDAVSRVHAFLMQTQDGAWYIRDNDSKNGVQVNGNKVKEAWLSTGDVVQVGNFVFRFRDPGSEGAAPAPEAAALEVTGQAFGTAASAAPKKKPNRRVLIYSVLGLVLIYALYSSQQSGDNTTKPADTTAAGDTVSQKLQKQVEAAQNRAKKLQEIQKLKAQITEIDARMQEMTKDGAKVEPAEFDKLVEKKRDLSKQAEKAAIELNTPEEPDTQLDAAKVNEKDVGKAIAGIEDPTLKEAEQDMAKLDWTNSSLREAEQFFRRGQRDYLTGEYQRAIDEFETALSFYRGHKMAEKYLRLSVFEVETSAKKHMQMALQYFESLQYQRAIYHFTEVVNLMSHRPQDPMVGEAEKYINLSKRRLQAAELFP
jgi:pSer/pThr/pTyr-binding forkhead associated (FHA) protein